VVVKTPYANLIGEYGSESEAAEEVARLDQKGISVYLVKGTGNSFQLMTGAFASQQASEMYRRGLEAKGLATRTVQR
jgi:cell division septation protein DedD